MKKVVVLSTSLRAGSNSHALAEQFTQGAKDAGHDVELISLRGKEIKFCIGCFGCQRTGYRAEDCGATDVAEGCVLLHRVSVRRADR